MFVLGGDGHTPLNGERSKPVHDFTGNGRTEQAIVLGRIDIAAKSL
jgi:hypothetical protein